MQQSEIGLQIRRYVEPVLAQAVATGRLNLESLLIPDQINHVGRTCLDQRGFGAGGPIEPFQNRGVMAEA